MLKINFLLFFGIANAYWLNAQCSTQDRRILLDFYKAMNGQNWHPNARWDTTDLACIWFGVRLNGSGRVTAIDLDNVEARPDWDVAGINGCTANLTPGLEGVIPVNFGQLTELQVLSMPNGRISGEFPDLSGTKIRQIQMSCNQLSGPLPGNRLPPTIQEFFVKSNGLEGLLPDFNNFTNVIRINVSDNKFTGPPPNFIPQIKIESILAGTNMLKGVIPGFRSHAPMFLSLAENTFTFEDLLPNYTDLRRHTLDFSRQKPVGPANGSITVPIGGDLIWDLGIDKGVTTSTYTWSNGTYTVKTNTAALVWEMPDDKGAGTWTCIVTNSIAKGDTLRSYPLQVLPCQPEVKIIDTTLCPGQSFTVKGIQYNRNNPGGKQQVKGAAANGCDSIYRILLRYPVPLNAGPDTAIWCAGHVTRLTGAKM